MRIFANVEISYAPLTRAARGLSQRERRNAVKLVRGHFVGQEGDRQLGHQFAAIAYTYEAILGDVADDHGVELPACKVALYLLFRTSPNEQQHAFLSALDRNGFEREVVSTRDFTNEVMRVYRVRPC